MPRRPGRLFRSPLRTVGPLAIVAVLLLSGPYAVRTTSAASGPTDGPRTLVAPSAGALSPAPAFWINRTATLVSAPPARWGASLAYDAADGYLLLFGGLGNSHGALRDTWSFANGTWTNRTSATGTPPTARYLAAMAYDPDLGGLLLFGGIHAGTVLGDTWEFSGGQWSALTPASSPPPLSNAAMAYDASDHQLLLYGGVNASDDVVGGTWAFANGTWTNLTGTTGSNPPALDNASMTFDAARNVTLLFGGSDGHRATNVTWAFADGRWTNVTASSGPAPPARQFAGLAYDAIDGFDLLFGGYRSTQLYNDSWAWKDGRWQELAVGPSPSPRNAMAMAYVPGPALGNASVVLFSGRSVTSASATSIEDTWTFKVPLSATLSASPAAFDVGDSTHLTVNASGGYPPYSLEWTSLPAGCVGPAAPATFTCDPSYAGAPAVTVTVRDAGGGSFSPSTVTLSVNLRPLITLDAQPSSGPAPMTVLFGDTLSGGTGPFSYLWTFGDGNSSNDSSAPAHTYEQPGTYSASVTVTDADGAISQSPAILLNVSRPLSVAATASTYLGVAPLAVHFDALPTGGEGTYTYNWSFGVPGAYAEVAAPSYTYSTPGVYPVVVRVSDSSGTFVTSGFNVTVITPLTATVTESYPNGPICSNGSAHTLVDFSGHATGGAPPYTYGWVVNGTALTGPTPTLVLPGGALVPINLTVTDARGEVFSRTTDLVVPTTSGCGTTTTGGGGVAPRTLEIAEGLGVLLAIVILVEVVLLVRGRRSS